jgi:lipopolysaccharide export system permease protein
MPLMDRYIASKMAKPFFAGVAIVIMTLTLENSARLMSQLDEVNEPFVVLVKFMGYLIPEYLSLGLVFALFAAVALAFRGLALSGEIDMLSAAGVSPVRMLRIPLLAAFACAFFQFGVRSYVEPWGESRLDALGQALRSGELGVAIAAGEFLRPSEGTTLHVARIDRTTNSFEQIMVQSKGLTMFAKSATAINTGSNVIILKLEKGQIVHEDGEGKMKVATFEQLKLPLSSRDEAADGQSVHNQNSRLNLNELATLAGGKQGSEGRLGARATLASRAGLALLVLLLPFIALTLAIPPKRGTTAFGIGLGVVLIVTYVQMSDAIGNRATEASPLLSAFLLFLFAVLALLLFQIHRASGGGYVEGKLQRIFAPASNFLARLFVR